MEWQPIATAPGGENVLVSDNEGRMAVAYRVAGYWHPDNVGTDDVSVMQLDMGTPNFWMPLPQNPGQNLP